MKKAVFALVACLVLVGCNSSDPSPSASPDLDETAIASVKWEGQPGAEPKLQFEPPMTLFEPTVGVVNPGDGEEISNGQLITFDCVVFDGATGEIVSSTYQTGQPETLILSVDTTEAALLKAFTELKVGANLIYGTPGEVSYDTTENSGASPSPSWSSSHILGMTVKSATTLPERAEGTTITPEAGLPEITVADDDSLAVKVPTADPPSELTVQTLIKGDGAAVEAGQTVAVRYVGWLWQDGSVFDSTWEATVPAAFSLDSVIQGWSQGIAGQTVGSRVLSVIPPALAYGGAGSDLVPPGATLIFVTDILAAY